MSGWGFTIYGASQDLAEAHSPSYDAPYTSDLSSLTFISSVAVNVISIDPEPEIVSDTNEYLNGFVSRGAAGTPFRMKYKMVIDHQRVTSTSLSTFYQILGTLKKPYLWIFPSGYPNNHPLFGWHGLNSRAIAVTLTGIETEHKHDLGMKQLSMEFKDRNYSYTNP